MAYIWEYIIAVLIILVYIYYKIQKGKEELEKEQSYRDLLNQEQD